MAIQSYNDNKSIVRDYTDSANVKDYVQNILVPKFFPRIPISGLKVGEIGLISEYLGDMVEDGSYGTSLGMNETFITRAVLDESIYSAAATFDLGYNYATPAACPVTFEVNYDDILKYAVDRQVYIDRDTKILINGYEYILDYDIRLTYTYIGGQIRFNAVYDTRVFNPVSKVNSPYIPCRVSGHWVLLYITVRECKRDPQPKQITDNMLFTASNINLPFSDMIAGLSAYYTYNGERRLMTNKVKYSLPIQSPFLYHRLKDQNTIEVSFASGKNVWRPQFNSQIDFTLYTTNGDKANFPITSDMECTVTRTGERYIYNEDLRIVAIPYGGSIGGNDQPDIEMVRWDTIEAFNTAHVLMTDDDISLYFENYSRRYNTVAKFFKRRDDPTGRLFGMFNIINQDGYIYETLTAKAQVTMGPGEMIDATTKIQMTVGWSIMTGADVSAVYQHNSGANSVLSYPVIIQNPGDSVTIEYKCTGTDVNNNFNIVMATTQTSHADPVTPVDPLDYVVAVNVQNSGSITVTPPISGMFLNIAPDMFWTGTFEIVSVTPTSGIKAMSDIGTYVPTSTMLTTTIYSGGMWRYRDQSNDEIERHTILSMTGENIGCPHMVPNDPENVYVNPFIMKINRYPGLVSYYNPLINYNSIMKQDFYEDAVLDHFIVTHIDIYRGIGENQYRISVRLVPSTPEGTYDEKDDFKNFKYNYFSDAGNTYSFSFAEAGINVVSPTNPNGNVNLNNGQQEVDADGNPNPNYLRSITEYLQDAYSITPANGCTVYDTDVLVPDSTGFEGKYVFNTHRDFIAVYPTLFPLRVVLSSETTLETNYTEMVCVDDYNGTYTFECYIETVNDVRVVQGNEVLCILLGERPYETKNIPGTTPTADAGTTFVFTSDTKMHIYTLFKSPLQDGVVINPSTDKGMYFDFNSGTPPISLTLPTEIRDARFNAIVKHLQSTNSTFTQDADFNNQFFVTNTQDTTGTRYRWIADDPTGPDWATNTTDTPNVKYDFSFNFNQPPSLYNSDPIIFSNNISAAYMSMTDKNGLYVASVPDGATAINKNDGTTYQYVASTERWLLLGSPSLFSDPTFRGWNITDSFINDYTNFDLLELWTQMRSTVIFNGSLTEGYQMDIGLVPYLRYDVATNPEKVSYVIRTMVEQYKAMAQLVSDRLEENTGIDFKLFNTCGRGVFYKIGVDVEDIINWQRIDSVSMRIKFVLGVHEEILYQDTMDAVKDHIKAFIETLDISEATIFSVSNLQRSIENNIPNVRYTIFLGINDYEATYQRIRLDDPYKVDMSVYEMQIYVPEKLTINRGNITIIHGD